MILKYTSTLSVFRFTLAFATAQLTLLSTPGFAADEITAEQEKALNLRIGLGVGAAPDYLGSNDYTVIPFPNFDLRYGQYGVRSSRLGIEADVVGIRGLDAGPIIRYDRGRSDVNDSAVALLPEIDGSVELGAFIGAGIPLSVLGVESQSIVTARIEALQGLKGGHEGATVGTSLGLVTPVTEDLTLIGSLSTTFMSKDYASSYFDVSAAGSAASGLSTFDAGSGFRDVGITVIGNYKLNENWSLNGIGSYTRLVGDAANSPIVKDRGSANQFLGGLGFSYTFK
jgi:outer membrane scaffolding protein for murein synthesis (MipA/OmpV family)